MYMTDRAIGRWSGSVLNPLVDQVINTLSNLHPLWIVLMAALPVTALCLLLCGHYQKKHRRQRDDEISDMVRQFVDERSKSESILADLDIGVLAFSSDGALISANPAARKMLNPQAVPEKFNDFIEAYGRENGLQAALLLGSEQLNAKLPHHDRILRIRLKPTQFDQERRAGTLVILQDITDSEHEERQRKEFVANVSHELKTPLTTIKTYSESLLDWGLNEKNQEAVRKDIWRIHDDSLRMERLVEDLLLLSSIDSKGIRVRMELLDFSRLVRQSVDRMQHQAAEKDLTMTCFTLSRFPMVFVDRTAMERVITNLLSNAIKYTERGGDIKVYISYLVDDIYVKVADTGFGIDKEHLPRIFNRFYRVDMTGSRMFGGTGLGLSIAKELIELHGGRIDVSSTLGKGTEFTLMIPIARKVFRDTLEQLSDPGGPREPLHRLALDELRQQAGDYQYDLDQLTADNSAWAAELLDKIFELDPQTDSGQPEQIHEATVPENVSLDT